MRKRICTFLCLAGMLVPQIFAKPVDAARAKEIAEQFTKGRSKELRPLLLSKHQGMRHMKSEASSSQPLYVFNIGNDNGFVIVSGDDELNQVLGYSSIGSFSMDGAPDNLVTWMDNYAAYVTAYQNDKFDVDPDKLSREGTVVVAPLLKDIHWGQDYPFNFQCPTYTSGGFSTHYYTGCVATAATQIMRYYNYPVQGSGSKSYVSNGKTLTADFGATTYDWPNMIDNYDKDVKLNQDQINALSVLPAHFGIAVEMQYAPSGSGAYTMMVPGALKKYFKYDNGLYLCMRNYYSTSEWMSLIKSELDASRPVYYAASNTDGLGGHAFVCDGYDSNDYVHINWGWNGSSDGFFMVNHMEPGKVGIGGGGGGYNIDQEIIVGIQPETGIKKDVPLPVYASTRLTASEIIDGSITLMSFVDNLDTEIFNGTIGAVITTPENEILQVLKDISVSIEGFANGRSSSVVVTMRDIVIPEGLKDGNYKLCLAYKSNQSEIWRIIRHGTGYPDHALITVENGAAQFKGTISPELRISLLEKITTKGDLYASGNAVFRIKLRNESDNARLKKIAIHFQSVADPDVSAYSTASALVYEESDEELEVSVNISKDMPAGDYYVTARDADNLENIFDDSQVGRAVMTIHPAVSVPVLRLEQAIEWGSSDPSGDPVQGVNLAIALAMKNYGEDGDVLLDFYFTDKNNPDKKYYFYTLQQSVKKGETSVGSFLRELPLDPGTYVLYVDYKASDGEYYPLDNSGFKDCEITVRENPETTLKIVSPLTFEGGDELIKGSAAKGTMTFSAAGAEYSGRITLRLRQFGPIKGEIMYMANHTIAAGEEKTVAVNYTPEVDPGDYLLLIESKVGSNADPVGGYTVGYKMITVKDPSGIDSPFSSSWKAYPNPVSDILHIEGINADMRAYLYDLNGVLMINHRVENNQINVSSLAPGFYYLKIESEQGVVARMIIKK